MIALFVLCYLILGFTLGCWVVVGYKIIKKTDNVEDQSMLMMLFLLLWPIATPIFLICWSLFALGVGLEGVVKKLNTFVDNIHVSVEKGA